MIHWVFIVLFSISSFAEQVKVSDLKGPRRNECLAGIKMLAKLALNRGGELHVKPLDQIEALFVLAGATEPRLTKMVDEYLKSSPTGEISKFVAKTLSDPQLRDHLIVCVPGSECGFHSVAKDLAPAAVLAGMPANFNMVPFESFQPPGNVRELFSRQHLDGLKMHIQVLFLPEVGSEQYRNGMMALIALHEIAHFADFYLLSKWISKNQQRLEVGQTPDALFQSVVRIKNGVLYMDQGFNVSLLETGGYQIMGEANKHYTGEDVSSDLAPKTYEYIVAVGGKKFLDSLGITPANLFQQMSHVRAILNE